jgi:hypothetical protein
MRVTEDARQIDPHGRCLTRKGATNRVPIVTRVSGFRPLDHRLKIRENVTELFGAKSHSLHVKLCLMFSRGTI